jgi:hypothetical protein
MQIKMNFEEKLRIFSDYEGDNFVNVEVNEMSSLMIDMFPRYHYVEIRKKEMMLRVFAWKRKSDKKQVDLGWWDDAEVVFALNETKR